MFEIIKLIVLICLVVLELIDIILSNSIRPTQFYIET